MSQTLLVADDSLTIQRVIKLAFAKEPLEVVAVSSGDQAIEQIEAGPPAIVLADTRMPERNGYEIAEFIKAKPDYEDIPVVLMTGAFEPVDDRRARAAGCEAVLVKPFEPEKLVSTVRDLLGEHSEPASDAPLAPPVPPAPAVQPRRSTPLGEPELTWPIADDARPPSAPVAASVDLPRPQAPLPSPSSGTVAPSREATDLVITDELVERLATRVIARLSDRVVRETTREVVGEVAERLVSDELARIKEKLR